MKINAIVTVPPYADFLRDIAKHPITSGFRLNTVMPTKNSESLEDVLKRLKDYVPDKNLWIDLKCRQLRIKTYGVPPFTEIELTHNISVKTPITAYFSDGRESATVLEAYKNKLIMQEGPKRVVGPGESINIPDASLKIEGYYTDTDKRYIEASAKLGLHDYMLSFVEKHDDKQYLLDTDPEANIVEKIESKKGMRYVNSFWDGKTRLMAARGDLYLEVDLPHMITQATENILKNDKNAIVASRILNSFSRSMTPSCEDIGDVDNLLRMGYRTLMLGDDICMQKDSVLSALNLLDAMGKRYY